MHSKGTSNLKTNLLCQCFTLDVLTDRFISIDCRSLFHSLQSSNSCSLVRCVCHSLLFVISCILSFTIFTFSLMRILTCDYLILCTVVMLSWFDSIRFSLQSSSTVIKLNYNNHRAKCVLALCLYLTLCFFCLYLCRVHYKSTISYNKSVVKDKCAWIRSLRRCKDKRCAKE